MKLKDGYTAVVVPCIVPTGAYWVLRRVVLCAAVRGRLLLATAYSTATPVVWLTAERLLAVRSAQW